jgi:hypothetical protein
MMRRRRLLLAFGCAALLPAVTPASAPGSASAPARKLYAPSDVTLPSRPFTVPFRDAVLSATAARVTASRLPVARASALRLYSTDGQGPITVDVSPSYVLTKELAQPYVDFLASRVHGTELDRLTLVLVAPGELARYCAPGALACYIPARELMIIPGEQTPAGQVPVEYVITHEYGHHVAANRDNDPWAAIGWGPKAWATQRSVCAGVAERRYFPNDQGANYRFNPGENWAETYAQLHYRNQFPWEFDPSFLPDEAAFVAAQRDIVTPWGGGVSQRRSGSLTRARRSKTFPVTTTLDGRVRLSLRGPSRANFDVQVLSGGRVVARSRRAGSRDTLTATDCQVRDFSVRVVRRSGSGSFTLGVQTPG